MVMVWVRVNPNHNPKPYPKLPQTARTRADGHMEAHVYLFFFIVIESYRNIMPFSQQGNLVYEFPPRAGAAPPTGLRRTPARQSHGKLTNETIYFCMDGISLLLKWPSYLCSDWRGMGKWMVISLL